MKISNKQMIGELVAHDYRTASVFKSHGIDFCCNGNRSLESVCEKSDLNAETLMDELNQVLQNSAPAALDHKHWPADLLADYIEKKHHRYVEKAIPEIKSYLAKIADVHGKNHPELLEIESLFIGSAGALAAHMKKEELILFPFIRKMSAAEHEGVQPEPPQFGTVENPVSMMKQEHDDEGARFRKIAELSSNYTAPDDACNTYRVAFALLREFETDLHLHIHLENNILFPKAFELEKKLFQSELLEK